MYKLVTILVFSFPFQLFCVAFAFVFIMILMHKQYTRCGWGPGTLCKSGPCIFTWGTKQI